LPFDQWVQPIDELGHAIQSHDEAIQAVLEANRAAIDLLERLSNDGQHG
jgi:hypothetical protein